MDGRTRCAAASQNVGQSPASGASISMMPVTVGGGNVLALICPGPGAQSNAP